MTDNGSTTWKIDAAHSGAEFKVKHMMISNVKGKFSGISGILHLDKSNLSLWSVKATIPVDSIHTADAQRDGHLKSTDFFDAEKFPTMTFQSTRITRTAPGEFTVIGDLSIHGVTRSVIFSVESSTQPAQDPWGNLRIGASATTKINRKDFGLVWNAALEAGGVLVGEDVTITLDVEFIQG